MAEARFKHVKFDFQSALDQLTQDTSWTLSEEQLTGIFRARAAALARRSHREQVERGTLHIRFMVHGVVFGVDLRHVRTITVPHWMTTVPGAPEHLARVFQVSGRIVSLLDLGALLALPRANADRQQAVLIDHKGALLGLVAHKLVGIAPVDTRELSPGTSATGKGSEFITGISADMTLVLDAPRLLSELRFESNHTG